MQRREEAVADLIKARARAFACRYAKATLLLCACAPARAVEAIGASMTPTSVARALTWH